MFTSVLVLFSGTTKADTLELADRVFDLPFAAVGATFSIAQVEGGAVLVAGAYGVSRWDGHVASHWYPGNLKVPGSPTFHAVANETGVAWLSFGGNAAACAKSVPCIEEWVGAPGVVQLKHGVYSRLPAIADGLSEYGWALAARGAELLVGTPDGLIRYRDGRGTRENLLVAGKRPFITALHFSRDGSLLFGTTAGLYRWRAETNTVATVYSGSVVTDVIEQSDGSVWAASRAGLIFVAPNGGHEIIGHAHGLPSDDVRAITAGTSGDIWVATSSGLGHMHDHRADTVLGIGLSDSRLISIAYDNQGGLWLGSRTAGVVRGQALPMQRMGRSQGSKMDETWAVSAGSDGAVWVIGSATQAALIENGIATDVSMPPELQDQSTSFIAALNGGRALVGGQRGLWILRRGAIAMPILGISLLDLSAMQVAHVSADTWELSVGNSFGVVVRYSVDLKGDSKANATATHMQQWSPNDAACASDIADLARVDDGSMWVAMKNGRLMELHSDGSSRCIDSMLNRTGLAPTGIAIDDRGIVWISARQGLMRFEGNTARVFDQTSGLACDNVAAIVVDHGFLWTACDGGVARTKIATLEHPAGRPVETLVFNQSNGMPSAESSFRAHPGASRAADGKIWVATARGVIAFSTRNDELLVPFPQLMNAQVPRHQSSSGVFSAYRGEPLSLQFDATALAFPRAVAYRFALTDEAGNVTRGEENSRSIELPLLLEGLYRLQGSVANAYGQWSGMREFGTLQITRRWHQQPIMWGIAVTLALAIAIFAFREREHRKNRLTQALQAEREKMARDLHDSVAQAFTSLSFHLEALLHGLPKQGESSTIASRALSVLQHFNEDTRRLIWNLRFAKPSHTSLAEGLRQLADDSSRGGPPCRLKIEGSLHSGDARIDSELLSVAKEALTNATKHARASKVLLEARRSGSQLRLRISDDGVGMNIDPERAVQEGHFGLLGMQERLRRLGGTLIVDSQPGAGTVVEAVVSLSDP